MSTKKLWVPVVLTGILASCGGEFPDQSIGGEGVSPRIADIQFSLDRISSGGSTEMEFRVVNGTNNRPFFSTDLTLDISSLCTQTEPPRAEIVTPTMREVGVFTTTYIAMGCSGVDIITVGISGGDGEDSSMSRTIRVDSTADGAIEGLPPEHSTIGIRGFGSENRPTQTRVPFLVKDNQGNPLPNQTVTFEVSNPVGGIELDSNSAVTNSAGIAYASVKSGTVNTVFKVRGTTEIVSDSGATKELATENPYDITVNSGLPMHIVFGPDVSNPADAGTRFGVEEPISLVLTDRTGGPPAEGTVVTFKTNAGLVVGDNGGPVESCVVIGGRCTLDWVSGSPWPQDGGVRVLAATPGDEYYIDQNGNGAYDIGELFCPTGEPFLDKNNNGVYDQGEDFIDTNGSGGYSQVPSQYRGCETDITNRPDALASGRFADGTGSMKYKGSSCTTSARAAGHCAKLGYLSTNAVMILSVPSTFRITGPSSVNLSVQDRVTLNYTVADQVWGNIPELGTTFEVDCDEVEATVISPVGGAMPNVYQEPGTSFGFTVRFKRPDDPENASDFCDIIVGPVSFGVSVTL